MSVMSVVNVTFKSNIVMFKGSFGIMNQVFALQPRDCGFEPHTSHDHDSSSDTSTGWFQEADSRVINISC